MYTLLGVAGLKLQQGIFKIYIVVKTGLILLYYKVIGALHILVTHHVQLMSNQLAKIKLNIKHLVAPFIIQGQLIKVGLILALHKVGALGQRLLTTVRQILQHVLALLKRGK